jgi:hypothetical protein
MIDYELYVNGQPVTASVHDVTHDMYAEGHADTAEFIFNDTSNTWLAENIVVGDTIRFVYGLCDTGEMYVTAITPGHGTYSVFAAAIPISAYERRYKSWDGVTFAELGQEIASNHNLKYAEYECDRIVYEYIKQDDIDDFTFFNALAVREGRGLLVYDGKIIAYDQDVFEHREEAKPIAVGYDGEYDYTNNAADCYGKCVVICAGVYGEATDPVFDGGKVLHPRGVHATSDAEAYRWAHGILRNVNKNLYSGTITAHLVAEICAASIIIPVNTDINILNENMFVVRVRQSYLGNETKIWFRKPYDL